MDQTNYNLYASDISSIAAASSDNTDSKIAFVDDVEVVAVQLKAEAANASIAANLVAKIVASVDGVNFDTQTFATVTLAKTADTEEAVTELINVRGIRAIMITEIENEDANYAVENVNAVFGKTIL